MKMNKMIGIAILIVAMSLLVGCASISKDNQRGTFPDIAVPAKDFTALGIVQTVNVIENDKGEVFTYHELLKLAQARGADSIVNVAIDVKYEGLSFLGFKLKAKATWYGSATAIKYAPGTLKETVTNNTDSTSVTRETIIMSSSSSGSGLFGGGGSSDTKKWYNPFTWF